MEEKNYKIVFMGTPEIGAKVLRGLVENGFNVVGLVAQPDKPVGRKRILEAVPTKKVALEYNIPVFQPEKIRNDYQFLIDIKPDVIITLAYGQIVPQAVLDIPTVGCVNLHGSLLPKYRGAAPIQYSLMNNDKVSGMSLMKMVKAMDAGEVYATELVEIDDNDNCTSLIEKMGDAALALVLRELPKYMKGDLKGVEQDESFATYCPTIKPEEERINIKDSAQKMRGLVRALSDKPGAYLYLDNVRIKIFKCQVLEGNDNTKVGQIIKADKNGLHIQTSEGILSILELQKEGKNKMDYKSFINGNANLLGKYFE